MRRNSVSGAKPSAATWPATNALVFLATCAGPRSTIRKNFIPGPDHEPLEKLDENSGVDPAFLLGHEPHLPARRDGRDQAHAVTSPRAGDHRGLSLPAPGATRMMIRAHVRGVAEVDIGLFPLRHRPDLRVFLLEPLLHQRLVAFQRAMQRLLASDAQLRQKPRTTTAMATMGRRAPAYKARIISSR
jgi:hypothetical protein